MISFDVLIMVILTASTTILYPSVFKHALRLLLHSFYSLYSLPSQFEQMYMKEQQIQQQNQSSSNSKSNQVKQAEFDDMSELSENDEDDRSYFSMSDSEKSSSNVVSVSTSATNMLIQQSTTIRKRRLSTADLKTRVHLRFLRNQQQNDETVGNSPRRIDHKMWSDETNEEQLQQEEAEDESDSDDNDDDSCNESQEEDCQNEESAANSLSNAIATTITAKRQSLFKKTVDQEIQCDPMDFETLEMRTVLPFRHKNMPISHYKTIRTDIDTSDMLNYQGVRYRIPAPYELYDTRETERVVSGSKSKFTRVGGTVRHIHAATKHASVSTATGTSGGALESEETSSHEVETQPEAPTTPTAPSSKVVGFRNRSKSLNMGVSTKASEPMSDVKPLARGNTVSNLEIETFKSNRVFRSAFVPRISTEHEEDGTESESEDLSTMTDTDDLVTTVNTPKPEIDSIQSPAHDSDDNSSVSRPLSDPVSPIMSQELNILYKIDMETILQQTESVSTSVSNQVLRILEHVKLTSDDCHPTDATGHLSNMKEKTTLTLCNNNLLTCPYSLMDAEQLVTLDLSHNYLSSVSNWMCESLKHTLTALSLCHNLLTDLPEKFSELKKLRELDLSYNKFEYIPHSVQQLPSLTSLDVSHNSIYVIAPGVCRLKHTLTELNFSYNNIMEVPEDLKNCRKLRYLKYSDNEIFYSSTSSVLNKISVEEVARKKPLRQRSHSSLLGALIGSNQSSRNVMNSSQSSLNTHLPSRILYLLDLLDSERRFIRYMNVFNDVYYVPLTTQLEELKKEHEFTISYNYLSVIIPSELYSILIFARAFLRSLLTKSGGMAFYESNPFVLANCEIGNIFLQNMESIRSLYVSYSILYDKAVDFLRELQRVNPEFDRYLKSRNRLPLCDGMSLESFLLLPIRRLSKYVDTLQNLLRVTPESHPDYVSTRKALKKMHKLVTIQQKNIFIINNKYKILELQRKLKVTDLLIPSRFLLKEGKLTLAQSRGINNFKKEIMKQFYNKSSVMESVKELNPYFETFKAKLTGSTVDDLWEVRLTELTVYVYLFSDVILIKETNLIQKLVGKFYLYSLRGAMVAEREQNEGNEKEFSLIIRVQTPSTKQSSTKLLTFICEDRRDCLAWYNAVQKTVGILNPSVNLGDTENVDSGDEEEGVDMVLDHAYENYDRESVLKFSEDLNTSLELPSPRDSGSTTPRASVSDANASDDSFHLPDLSETHTEGHEPVVLSPRHNAPATTSSTSNATSTSTTSTTTSGFKKRSYTGKYRSSNLSPPDNSDPTSNAPTSK